MISVVRGAFCGIARLQPCRDSDFGARYRGQYRRVQRCSGRPSTPIAVSGSGAPRGYPRRQRQDANLSKTFGTYSDFVEYARISRSFEKLAFATWAGAGANLTGHGLARNVLSIPTSEDLFAVVGVSAARSRTFEHADLAHGCSVVLADSFWRTTLGGDPNVTGKTLELDHRDCAVLGVVSASFEFYPRTT